MSEVHSCVGVFCVAKYHCLMADLYDLRAHTKEHDLTDAAARDKKLAERHRHTSASIKSAILDLFWDPDRVSFYDYNLTASARGDVLLSRGVLAILERHHPVRCLDGRDQSNAGIQCVGHGAGEV
jgi:hypothetical protein